MVIAGADRSADVGAAVVDNLDDDGKPGVVTSRRLQPLGAGAYDVERQRITVPVGESDGFGAVTVGKWNVLCRLEAFAFASVLTSTSANRGRTSDLRLRWVSIRHTRSRRPNCCQPLH